MSRKPRPKNEPIMTRAMIANVVITGIMICVFTLFLFNYGLNESPMKAQTMAFTSLVVFEVVRVFMIRSQYKIGIFSNKYLILAISASLGLQILVVYLPLLGVLNVFHTTPLMMVDWMYILFTTALMLVIGLTAAKIVSRVTQQHD